MTQDSESTDGGSEEVYKYTVPLEVTDGSESPAYSLESVEDVYYNMYKSDSVIIVVDEPMPHFHKDSMNVGVEKVPKEEYVD